MKKFFLTIALLASLLLCSCGSEADKANYNISKQADYFESERKITVYNARTDTIILEAETIEKMHDDSQDLAALIVAEKAKQIKNREEK